MPSEELENWFNFLNGSVQKIEPDSMYVRNFLNFKMLKREFLIKKNPRFKNILIKIQNC